MITYFEFEVAGISAINAHVQKDTRVFGIADTITSCGGKAKSSLVKDRSPHQKLISESSLEHFSLIYLFLAL